MTETHASSLADDSGTTAAAGAVTPLQGRALRLVMLVLAFAAGASVANLYYAQPLLSLIRHDFGTSSGTAALVVTLTQVGYALGLALLLPLGDLFENRRLASRTLIVTALALAVTAAAPDFGVFLVMSLLVGVTSVVAQVLCRSPRTWRPRRSAAGTWGRSPAACCSASCWPGRSPASPPPPGAGAASTPSPRC
jgi:MFS family permease